MRAILLVLACTTSTATLASAQPSALNASAPSIVVPTNSSLEGARMAVCSQPANAVYSWWFNKPGNGVRHTCYGPPYLSWSMLNAYRSGGTKNVDWKYTDNDNDPDCLYGWSIYSENGQNRIGWVGDRTTRFNSDRKWCALAVYRSGGVQGRQWEYCKCWDEPNPPGVDSARHGDSK